TVPIARMIAASPHFTIIARPFSGSTGLAYQRIVERVVQLGAHWWRADDPLMSQSIAAPPSSAGGDVGATAGRGAGARGASGVRGAGHRHIGRLPPPAQHADAPSEETIRKHFVGDAHELSAIEVGYRAELAAHRDLRLRRDDQRQRGETDEARSDAHHARIHVSGF